MLLANKSELAIELLGAALMKTVLFSKENV